MDASAEPNRNQNGNGVWGFYRRYFAQRPVSDSELPDIMRRHIYTGAMGSVWGTMVSGVFFVYFGNAVGMSPADWGLMGGFASFILTAELLSARMTRRAGRRKVQWFWFSLVSRTVRLLGILLRLWLFHAGYTQVSLVLIASVCLSNFLGAMAGPPWMSWLADIIPTAKHGRFWARRTWWINLSIIVAVLPAAWLIDWVDLEWKMTAAVGVFFISTLIGIMDLVIHGTIPEPAMTASKEEGEFVEQFKEPLHDKGFRAWLVYTACWTFAISYGGSLAIVYFLSGDGLGLGDNMIGATVVVIIINQIGTLIGSRKWGLYVDRYGVKPVLFWGSLFWSFWPLFWFFATKDTAIFLMGIASFIGGSSVNAAVIAGSKYITRYPPPGHQVATYSAVSNVVSYWASGVACLLAGLTVKLIGPGHMMVWGISLCAFHVLFGLSFLMRLGSTLFLIPRIKMPEHLSEVAETFPGGSVTADEFEERGDWTSLLRP